MEPPRTPPNPPNLPAVPDPPESGRPPASLEPLPPRYEPPPQQPPRYPPPQHRPPTVWSRLRLGSRRGAIGLGLAAAALLLLPFLDDPGRWWVPVGLGLGTLVLLYLLRLDRLLRGWAPHVAGVVLVVALMQATRENPWAWAFAASVAVVVAGLLRLPRWQVLAVGAVLLVVSVAGYSFRAADVAQRQDQIAAQAGQVAKSGQGERNPNRVLPALLEALAEKQEVVFCGLLRSPATEQVAAATGAPDCAGAFAALSTRVTAPSDYADTSVPAPVQRGERSWTVDGCRLSWPGADPGPQLGRLQIGETFPMRSFVVTGYQPC
ncbi:hypothetical protein [Pseudonocardia sp. H11422]|uniref:hypothetical protein n=1 Tax=Pseudonocardia sp. H11422 TaxID=2835866 RepID=UPI001BDC1F70|nr:hypothetical protein [Pseudonocardia sp. H11422]